MTNKEAIKIINNMPNYKPWEVEALGMAIKALERVHTMSKEEMEAYLKDEDLVVVKRKYLKKALKVLDQISHLTDCPCKVCEFYTEEGCSKWKCVFEGRNSE